MEVQMRIIVLCFVMISSATDEVKNLTGAEGGSITLPDPVVELGFLSLGGKPIAMVTERKITILEEIYKDRLLLNSNTGLFTLSGLQRTDSGIYYIDSKKGRVFTSSYKLTVYESVPTPAVKVTSVSADSCTLLCLVEKAEETSLLWYKDEEIVNQSSSALSLPLTVHKQDFSSSYRCVAANPAENKTHAVHVSTSCSGQNDTATDTRHHMIGIAISIVATVIIILVACNIKWKYFDKRRTRQAQDAVNRGSDVEYSDIQICEDRRSQGENVQEPSGNADHSNLKTIYYKLEAQRLVPIYTDTTDVYEI
ncbi:CD48 antigen-like isoform X5 [Micropterus salmoides]|uniref:CD48 antigen-like isoform X5 n=1 Tax=Micropterus salmoides TaxID=27706 RepID=UPI0018EC3E4A|nr:CD48 antigen-like isoform X5 [Micropterus salmoides]